LPEFLEFLERVLEEEDLKKDLKEAKKAIKKK
jgi:hypothetical protein